MQRLDRLLIVALGCAVAAPALSAPAPAPAQAGQARADAAPETQLCLENRALRAKELSATHGYYVRTSQGWWRNTGPACPAYGPNRALATQSTQNRQCRGDVVNVFDPFSRIQFGGCVLGAWERVSGPPKN
ncbi:hypothetical protein [Polymorphobacter fuscus]|uniref:Uncharacterized protein n=1 Tax=Sandarakinorhabdus fusca TaxID=1439888 RepID=A0A7C9GQR8_9SPHN|nr:hypothetical protein [Polymorphobacter fuscus]KAB7645485.1 hypothetical protein F9290_11675 [Polymorphobacter fuscus]MQT17916.1 hypothetical protein [Polymorphobacter fuscus]NJC08546.1 hypothetical protein [Polymorphobacter fuscus]